MKMIVAVTDNWGIGKNNDLLYRIPEDLKYFKEKTLHHPILMGRKTWESLSGPLPKRENIVLTTSNLSEPNIHVIHDINELSPTSWDGFCIGGASLYEQCLPYTDTIYVTHINKTIQADKFFPNLTKMPEWQRISISPIHTYQDIQYQFAVYKKQY